MTQTLSLKLEYMARKADGTDVRGYMWGDAREPDLLWQHLRGMLNDPGLDLVAVHDFVFSEFINSLSAVARGSISPSPPCADPNAEALFLRFWIMTMSIGTVPDICGHAIRRFMGPEGETWWRLEVQMEYDLPQIIRDAKGLDDAADVTQQLDRLFMDIVESRTRGTTSGRYNELVLHGPQIDIAFPDFYDVLLLAARQGRRVDLSLPVILETATTDGVDTDLDVSDFFVLDRSGDIFGPNHYGWRDRQAEPDTPVVVVLDPGLQAGLADVWTLLAEKSISAEQGFVLATDAHAQTLCTYMELNTIVGGLRLGDTSWLDTYCRCNPGADAEHPKLMVIAEPSIAQRVIKDRWTPPDGTFWMLVLVSRSVLDAVAVQSMAIAGARSYFYRVSQPLDVDDKPSTSLVVCATQQQCADVCELYPDIDSIASYAVAYRSLGSATWVFCEDMLDHPAWVWYPILKAYCERVSKPKVLWAKATTEIGLPLSE